MEIDTEAWVASAMDAESAALADLLATLPPSTIQSTAAQLARSRQLDSRVYALRSVSQDHSAGGDPRLAAALAEVGRQFCESCFEQIGPGTANTFVFGVAQFAMDAQRAYDRMQRRSEQLATIDSALAWLHTHEAEEKNLIDLRFARVEALLECGRVEDAQSALMVEASYGNANHPLFGVIQHRIRNQLVSATEPKDTRTATEQADEQREQGLATALQGIAAIAPEFAGALRKPTDKLAGELSTQPKASASAAESIARDSGMYQKLGRFMDSMAGGSGHQLRLNVVIQETSATLADPVTGFAPAALTKARETLEHAQSQAREHGLEDVAVDTLWPLYICYKRLQIPAAAIDALQQIRTWVSLRRDLIRDPMKRAGVSLQYPHLHVELAARLFEQGNSQELLNVMEEAKGRALADLLALEGREVTARDGAAGLFYGYPHGGSDTSDTSDTSETTAEWLPALMTRLDAHYLTFLMDTNTTFAVCVTKAGGLHAARLSMGDEEIEALRTRLDPSTWGQRSFFSAPIEDLPQRLSPLVAWLGDLFALGALTPGDHLCYSPDNLLHLVPLHYADLLGEPLVAKLSLSRTHCAALLRAMPAAPQPVPARFVALRVPLAAEITETPEKVQQLARVPDWLEHNLPMGERFDLEAADIDIAGSVDWRHAVVHFATHGYFPGPEEKSDPFHGAGLLLSHHGQLPSDQHTAGLLSPARIIASDAPLDFEGSHVTLQACVSGLSREGAAGDALGLEWSLLIAGADSVLSSHWNIPVEESAQFSVRFFEHWLSKGCSRGEAWRNAVLSQMDPNRPFAALSAYHWAAFSLAGDWR